MHCSARYRSRELKNFYGSMKSVPSIRRSDPSNICNGFDNVNSISSNLLKSVNWRVGSVRKSPNTTSVKKHVYKHNMTAKPAPQQLREIHLAWISLKAEIHCPVSQKLTTHEGKEWCHLSEKVIYKKLFFPNFYP